MYEKISLLKPPKDENGYPIHSDGSRLSIFIILKAKGRRKINCVMRRFLPSSSVGDRPAPRG
ncbi:hypothetical protein F2Z23_19705, partial [Bacteroides eggerthii]